MRKLRVLICTIFILIATAGSVCAATGVSKQESFATVAADGSCQVTTTVTLHLEEPVDNLYFPIPREATGVTLNGSRVNASRKGDVRQINLSRLTKNVVGDVTVSIHYSLYDVIETTETGLEMQVPLLSGFAYPVDVLSFSVTLPGQIDVLPGFVSGYHQARIEEDLTYAVSGATISGSSLKAMKDHETLVMSLVVTEEMFPRSIVQSQDYHWGTTAMALCGVAALVFFLVSMWNLPMLPRSAPEPPQGFHAGQAGSLLAGQGTDLTMAVLDWAQLGYILIQVQRNGRVILHKRMEMGNERNEAEVRLFAKLFGKKDRIDTGDYRYAQLYRMAGKQLPAMKELRKRFNGNSRIFRGIAAGIGLFGGAALAVAMAAGAALQGLLLVLLAVAGLLSGWYIQGFGPGVLLGDRRKLKISLSVSGLWLVMGLMSGAFTVALWMVLGLMLAGLLYAWGGRRTEQGRQMQGQMLGLKWYLMTADKRRVQEQARQEPDYFFRMLPWAVALGEDVAFARKFGGEKPDRCPYLTTGMDGHMTATQWCRLFRQTVDTMNRRANNLPLEKFFGILRSVTKV